MQIKFISFVIFLFACFTQIAQASLPPKPSKCPGVSAISSVGIQIAQPGDNGTWVAGVLSNRYDTTDAWTFAVGDISASSEQDAKAKATDSLSSLNFKMGPIPVTQYNVWACLYTTSQGYRAIAVTPSLGLVSSSHSYK